MVKNVLKHIKHLCHMIKTEYVQWNLRIKDNRNSAVVTFVERLSSLRRFKMYYNYREANLWDPTCVFCRKVYYIVSLLGGSTIGGSTVHVFAIHNGIILYPVL